MIKSPLNVFLLHRCTVHPRKFHADLSMQSFSLRETLILVLNPHKTHLGRCQCSAKSGKRYLVIHWNINYRARDTTVYWVTILSEPPCNPPQSLPRTFVEARRLAAFEELPTHGITGLCLQWGRQRCELQWFLSALCLQILTCFNFPSSPQVSIFQNFWTINTTTLGNEGSTRLKTVPVRICVPTSHTCL